MKRTLCTAAILAALAISAAPLFADDEAPASETTTKEVTKKEAEKPVDLKAKQSKSEGSVTVEGKRIDYTAEAGTILLNDKKDKPTASIFYTAYFKKGADASQRPLMFLYNGGPGSSTIWLHMGAFGPKRVVTDDDQHTAPAPYGLVNNDFSLLDVADLVFIDAPGAGFSTFAD